MEVDKDTKNIIENLQSEVEISSSQELEESFSVETEDPEVSSQNDMHKSSDKNQQISAVIDGKVVQSSMKVEINGQTFHIFSPQSNPEPGPQSEATDVLNTSNDHGYQVSKRKRKATSFPGYETSLPGVKKEKTSESSKEAQKGNLKIKIKTSNKLREDVEEMKRQEKQKKKHKAKQKSIQHICMYCNKKLPSKGELNKHLVQDHGTKAASPKAAIHSPEKNYSAKNLEQPAPVPDQLYGVPLPEVSQDNSKKHICNICDKFYYLESNLERHILRDHFGGENQDYGQVDETQSHDFGYTAAETKQSKKKSKKSKTYEYEADISAASMHRQLYHKYNCELCNYKSHYKHNLERHMELNHGDYGETCDICDINFTSKSQLENHNKNMHSSGYTLNKKLRSSKVTVEEQDLVPERKKRIYAATYRCEQCNEVFTSLSDLEEHMDYHYAPAVFE